MSGEDHGEARLANTLRRVRFDKRVTRRDLSEKSGVPERTIRYLERHDDAVPQDETLFALADGLGVEPSWLLGEFRTAQAA